MTLKPCPFCGSPATLWNASWTNLPRVGCSNKNCLVKPATTVHSEYITNVTTEPVIIDLTTDYHKELEQKVIKIWNNRS
jgi:hypothetical protein